MRGKEAGYRVLGTEDELAQGAIVGLIFEFILWWPLVCTPHVGPKKVGPVTVEVDSVCTP